jgi:hypothetical protein
MTLIFTGQIVEGNAMQWDFAIAIVGTAASLCSVMMSEPTLKSRSIHVIYTAAIVLVIFILTSHSTEVSNRLAAANQRLSLLQDVQRQARGLLTTIPTFTSDPGTNRGTILKVISFLEKYKTELPDTYLVVGRLADGVGLTNAAKPFSEGGSEQRESLSQAGTAARSILEGLASDSR